MKKLRIGIVGTGGIVPLHLDASGSNPHIDVIALCGSDYERSKKRAMELGIREAYGDYCEMFNSGSLDAVIITTYNNTHAPITLAALEAGLHVLCEKPPAMNASEADKMKEAADRNNKVLMYGFVRRFSQPSILLKKYIEQGTLGEIYSAKTGYIRRCGNPGGWFAQKDISGGGPLIDLGVHIIDLCMYLMGKPKPVAIFGNTYSKLGSRPNIKGYSWYKAANYDITENNVEDLANAIIKFENGSSMFFETSWTLNTRGENQYMDLFGTKGGASLWPEIEIFGEQDNYMTNMKPVLNNSGFNAKEAFSAQIDHFARCILEDEPCICPAEDGVTIMKIIDAVYESARTGELVKLG